MRFAALIFSVLFWLPALVLGEGEKRPNVLFLAVDDMNDWIGCLETTPRAITPNIDRLAARGVNFTNAHTAGIYAPHFPNYCPQKYFNLYDPNKIELPPYKKDDLDDLPAKIRKMKTARSRIHQKLERLGAVDDAIHGCLACMSYADAMMGRVLDALAASPHADNTIVVLWSDHGYHHGEKGDWGKHTLWERTSNVPFIWAGPTLLRGPEQKNHRPPGAAS